MKSLRGQEEERGVGEDCELSARELDALFRNWWRNCSWLVMILGYVGWFLGRAEFQMVEHPSSSRR